MELTLIIKQGNQTETFGYDVLTYSDNSEIYQLIRSVKTEYLLLVNENKLLSPIAFDISADITYFDFKYLGKQIYNGGLGYTEQNISQQSIVEQLVGSQYAILKTEVARKLLPVDSLIHLSYCIAEMTTKRINFNLLEISSFVTSDDDIEEVERMYNVNALSLKTFEQDNQLLNIVNNVLDLDSSLKTIALTSSQLGGDE